MSFVLLSRCVSLRARWAIPVKGTPIALRYLRANFSASEGSVSPSEKYLEAATNNNVAAFTEQLRMDVLSSNASLDDSAILCVNQFLSSPVKDSVPALQWLSYLTKLGLRFGYPKHNEVALSLVKHHTASNTLVQPSKSFSFVNSVGQSSYNFGDSVFSPASKASQVVKESLSEDDQLFITLIVAQVNNAIEHCTQKSDIDSLLSSLGEIKFTWSNLSSSSQCLLLSKISTFYTTVDLDSDLILLKSLSQLRFQLVDDNTGFMVLKSSTLVNVVEKLLAIEDKGDDFTLLLNILNYTRDLTRGGEIPLCLSTAIDKAIQTLFVSKLNDGDQKSRFFDILRQLKTNDEISQLELMIKKRMADAPLLEAPIETSAALEDVKSSAAPTSAVNQPDISERRVTVMRTVTVVETVQTFVDGEEVSVVTLPATVTKSVTDTVEKFKYDDKVDNNSTEVETRQTVTDVNAIEPHRDEKVKINSTKSIPKSVVSNENLEVDKAAAKNKDRVIAPVSSDRLNADKKVIGVVRPKPIVKAWSEMSEDEREQMQNNLINYKGIQGSSFLPANMPTTLMTLSERGTVFSHLKTTLQQRLIAGLCNPSLFVYDEVTVANIVSVFRSLGILKIDYSLIERGCFDTTLSGLSSVISRDDYLIMFSNYGTMNRQWKDIPRDVLDCLLSKIKEGPLSKNAMLSLANMLPVMTFDLDLESNVDKTLEDVYWLLTKAIEKDLKGCHPQHLSKMAVSYRFLLFLRTFPLGQDMLDAVRLSVPKIAQNKLKGTKREAVEELKKLLSVENGTSCGGELQFDFSKTFGPMGALDHVYPLYLRGRLIALLRPVVYASFRRGVEYNDYLTYCFHGSNVVNHALPAPSGNKEDVMVQVNQMMNDIRQDLMVRFSIISADEEFTKALQTAQTTNR